MKSFQNQYKLGISYTRRKVKGDEGVQEEERGGEERVARNGDERSGEKWSGERREED